MSVEDRSEEPPPLLTARAAARYLSVSLTTLAKIEEMGLMAPFRTPGGHRRYSKIMLDAYLEASREWGAGGAPSTTPADGGGSTPL